MTEEQTTPMTLEQEPVAEAGVPVEETPVEEPTIPESTEQEQIDAFLEEEGDPENDLDHDLPEPGAQPEPGKGEEPVTEAKPAAEVVPEGEKPAAAEAKPTEPVTEPKPGEGKPDAEKIPQTPAAVTATPPVTPEEPGATPTTEPAQPLTREEMVDQFNNWRSDAEVALSTKHYALDEETAAELEADPASVIPKLMSRVYLDSITAATGSIMQQLPQMMAAIQQMERDTKAGEDSFFREWPQLVEHRDTVTRMAMTYRQVNPKATSEQFIRDVGAQALIALRLQPTSGVVPAAAVVTDPVPFTPAATTLPGMAAPAQPTNAFAKLNEEFAEEEAEF